VRLRPGWERERETVMRESGSTWDCAVCRISSSIPPDTTTGMVDEAGMDEALAVSRVAMEQYKRIRQDYRQLLGRRAQGVVRTGNAPIAAKKVSEHAPPHPARGAREWTWWAHNMGAGGNALAFKPPPMRQALTRNTSSPRSG
jgi:hypothetical protein